jgi:hypothetical protein
MSGLPSLALLAEEAAAELAAQERRGDSLDSKAGIMLGFSGVLVALSVSSLSGTPTSAPALQQPPPYPPESHSSRGPTRR